MRAFDCQQRTQFILLLAPSKSLSFCSIDLWMKAKFACEKDGSSISVGHTPLHHTVSRIDSVVRSFFNASQKKTGAPGNVTVQLVVNEANWHLLLYVRCGHLELNKRLKNEWNAERFCLLLHIRCKQMPLYWFFFVHFFNFYIYGFFFGAFGSPLFGCRVQSVRWKSSSGHVKMMNAEPHCLSFWMLAFFSRCRWRLHFPDSSKNGNLLHLDCQVNNRNVHFHGKFNG